MVGSPLEPPPRQQRDAVELSPDERQQRRKERHCCEDGHGGNQETADAEAAHERQRHEQQHRQPDRDGRPAEHDRAARRRHRPDDRVVAGEPVPQLFAEPVHDEQRVVDCNPEADQRDEVLEVGRELHVVREHPDDRERRRDGHERERERQQEGERPEGEDEDEQGDWNRDELSPHEVPCEDRVEVALDRRLSREVDGGARNLSDRRTHVVRVALGVGGRETRDDLGDDNVVGQGLHGDHAARRQLG